MCNKEAVYFPQLIQWSPDLDLVFSPDQEMSKKSLCDVILLTHHRLSSQQWSNCEMFLNNLPIYCAVKSIIKMPVPQLIPFTWPSAYLWHCSRTQSNRAFLAETLKWWCSGELLGGTGLLLAEWLERVECVSRLAKDSIEDWRESKERQLASSSI